MTEQNLKHVGPWRATITVHSDRRNLFELHPNHEFHIGTIVSGSKSEIPRFDYYVSLIEKTPIMREILIEVFEKITSPDRQPDPDFDKLAIEIQNCLSN